MCYTEVILFNQVLSVTISKSNSKVTITRTITPKIASECRTLIDLFSSDLRYFVIGRRDCDGDLSFWRSIASIRAIKSEAISYWLHSFVNALNVVDTSMLDITQTGAGVMKDLLPQ